MIDLHKAKHILEVACGTGKIIPIAMTLKQDNCTYLASDLSSSMIELCRDNLNKNL